jgi:regulator of sigma E protease
MSNAAFYLAAFAVLLGGLIVVHELGHYLVARWCGVKVLRFSLGFGPVLWSRRCGRDATEWVIAAFPLGGYVRMLDEREAPVAEEELARAFNRQSVGKRSAIVAAGPLANFLLAIFLYWGIFWHGSEEMLPVLGTPPAMTAAATGGFANGDRVVAVDGEEVKTWQDFRWILMREALRRERVTVAVTSHDGGARARELALTDAPGDGWQGDAIERLGVVYYQPFAPAIVGSVIGGEAGAQAGLQVGDRVLNINGQEIASFRDLVLAVRAAPGQVLDFTVEREGARLHLTVRPHPETVAGQRIGRIGVGVSEALLDQTPLQAEVSYGLFAAGAKALREAWDKSVFSLEMLGRMVTGEVSWRNLSGPVTIADYAGRSARLGVIYYLKFMALVSISLGVLNLLPVPVLDGGHLMYHILEVIKRGPLSERAMEVGQRIGLSFLLLLMAFAFFNDISRLFSG